MLEQYYHTGSPVVLCITGNAADDDVRACLRWLGCFDAATPVDPGAACVEDAFCALLQSRARLRSTTRNNVMTLYRVTSLLNHAFV